MGAIYLHMQVIATADVFAGNSLLELGFGNDAYGLPFTLKCHAGGTIAPSLPCR